MTRRTRPRPRRAWAPARLGSRAASAALARLAAVAALAVAAAGCAGEGEARAQWVVFVGTDATVPQFGDRLLVEVLNNDGDLACLDCRRQFGASDPESWPFSFGVVAPESGAGLQVRAQLYRADHVDADGLPFGVPVIDALAGLPKTDTAVDVGVELRMACIAKRSDPSGAKKTCSSATGELTDEPELAVKADGGDLPSPGSWPDALPVPCSTDPPLPSKMICHPGGVYVLGDPYFFPMSAELDPLPEHLIKLSPFAIDEEEFTVGQMRGLVATGMVQEAPGQRVANPTAIEHACTYLGDTLPTNDNLPVNCVSRALAEAACAALGKRLPTEAEWEFAAVNRTRETRFPWGDTEVGCSRAIVGRGRTIDDFSGMESTESTVCRGSGADAVGWGPVEASVAGDMDGDITDLGVKNMAGNVSEWVADRFNAYDEGCWDPNGPVLLRDPLCKAGTAWSVRGGSWDGKIFRARSVERGKSDDGAPSVSTGFRCAKSMM